MDECNTIGGTLPQNDRVSHEIHEDNRTDLVHVNIIIRIHKYPKVMNNYWNPMDSHTNLIKIFRLAN